MIHHGKQQSWWQQKTAYVGALLVAVVATVGIGVSALAWGPSDRATYTIDKPADHVAFNSITNNPAYGDERNFLRIKEATASDSTYSDEVKVVPGKTYEVYIYYHNNASSTYNSTEHNQKGIAKNTKLRVNVANGVKTGEKTRMTGYITADNATPKEVWDEAYITSDTDVALRYVPGSAKLTNRGAANGSTLADTLLSTGAPLGFDSLNGSLPGCNEYSGYVTFKFTADQPNFTFKKQVSKKGENKWSDKLSVSPGEEIEYLLSYQNTGTTQQNNVIVKDQLAKNTTYVTGSTNVANSRNPNGASEKDGITLAAGLNLGSYSPQGTFYAKFGAKIADAKDLVCGENVLTNTATVSTENGSKSDTAEVVVTVDCKPNECKPGIPTGDPRCDEAACVPKDGETVNEKGECIPAALPTTGPAEIIAGILGVTLVSLVAAYWLRSRHAYKQALAGFREDASELPETKLLTARTESDAKEDKTHI